MSTQFSLVDTVNDDCLREVLQYLNIMDFNKMAHTCRRINDIAKGVFRRKYRNAQFEWLAPGCRLPTLGEMEQLLSSFGEFITSIYTYCPEDNDSGSAISLLLKYCPKIVDLNLYLGDDWEQTDVEAIKSLVFNVKHLTTSAKYLFDGIFSENCQIEKLLIETMDKNASITVISLPKLRELSLEGFKLTKDHIDNVVTLNRQIECLKLANCEISADIIRSMPENLPNIQRLDMCTCSFANPSPAAFENWRQLTELKHLVVSADKSTGDSPLFVMRNLLVQHLKIEHLAIPFERVGINFVNNMPHLKRLTLKYREWSMSDSDLLDIVRTIANVPELCIESTSLTMFGVREILERKNQLRRLQIDFYGDHKICESECDNIANLMQLWPELKFKLTVCKRKVRRDVSNHNQALFSILY